MQVALHKLGLFRMTMGIETKPQEYVENNKFLNWFDEAFRSMCTHISYDILFHIEELRTMKEAWKNIKYLFGK